MLHRYGGEILAFVFLMLALVGLAGRLAVTNRHLQVERLRNKAHAEERERLLASLGEGVYGVDLEGRCSFINPAALDLLGWKSEEVFGADQHALFHHSHADGAAYAVEHCPIHQTLTDGIARRTENEWFLRRNGEGFPVSLVVTPVEFGSERIGAVAVFRDLTEHKRMEEELLRLATTDPLTGLWNRRRFLERLDLELARLHRLDSPPTALLMLDLDLFKRINDTYGHAAGDVVLRHLVSLLRSLSRSTDAVGRLGGEEFAMLLPGAPLPDAVAFAERLRERIALRPIEVEGGLVQVTISIGVTLLSAADMAGDAPLARADEALYRAKSAGRNRVEESLPPGVSPGPEGSGFVVP